MWWSEGWAPGCTPSTPSPPPGPGGTLSTSETWHGLQVTQAIMEMNNGTETFQNSIHYVTNLDNYERIDRRYFKMVLKVL